jgi:hypothetical protein
MRMTLTEEEQVRDAWIVQRGASEATRAGRGRVRE